MNHFTPAVWTFEAASTFWTDWSHQDVEAAGLADEFQAAEQALLSHRARTLNEAAIQLRVVVDAMVGGGRSDGLDIEVVRRVQNLIGGPALTVAPRKAAIGSGLSLARPQ